MRLLSTAAALSVSDTDEIHVDGSHPRHPHPRLHAQKYKTSGGDDSETADVFGGVALDGRDGELFAEEDPLMAERGGSNTHKKKKKHGGEHPTNGASTQLKNPIERRGAGSSSTVVPRALMAAGSSIREKLSILAVIVHLCKGNIGPGAMSLPYGFSRTGIYAAPVMFVLVVCCLSLSNCSILSFYLLDALRSRSDARHSVRM